MPIGDYDPKKAPKDYTYYTYGGQSFSTQQTYTYDNSTSYQYVVHSTPHEKDNRYFDSWNDANIPQFTYEDFLPEESSKFVNLKKLKESIDKIRDRF